MDPSLSEELLSLLAEDESVRAELAASGELFKGYHPRMAAVHAANAEALNAIISKHGWPGRALVGEDGANAAWLLLQHAIGNPPLQRRCLPLLVAAAEAGDVPKHQPAYLEDRIRCFEGRPQRFGTPFDWDEDGRMNPLPLEDEANVDRYREDAGLGPLSERIEQVRRNVETERASPPGDYEAYQQEKRDWARSVGWR